MEKLRLWQICTVFFALTTLALIIAVAVISSDKDDVKATKPCSSSSEPSSLTASSEHHGVFDDLTETELRAVRDYMLNHQQLNITPFYSATVNSNYIFLIELHPPTKDEVLSFLDGDGPRPKRVAKVVVHAGARDPPVVEEYAVHPPEKPTTHSRLVTTTKSPIPFINRAADMVQTIALDPLLREATRKMYRLLYESYDGFVYHNCTDRCLTLIDSAPRDTSDGRREAWVWVDRVIRPRYVYQVDIDLLVDCSGNDASKWTVKKVVYNYQAYDSVEKLMQAYEQGTLKKSYYQAPPDMRKKSLSTSLYPKGDPPKYQPEPKPGPEMYEPAGNRFRVDGRRVTYMDWSFDVRFRSSCGLQLFDIRFKDDRIVYELSLQEAASFYTSASPTRGYGNYMDSGYGMGNLHSELVPGWDCPATARFLDVVQLTDNHNPKTTHNAICVFEWNKGIPLRRHFNVEFGDKSSFYGALHTHVLVVRTIASVYNYDYIYDYMFHLNGVIEVKVSMTGYLLAGYYTDKEKDYAIKVESQMSGAVHDHFINYKVDLDVAGRKNSFEYINLETETVTGWQGEQHTKKKIVRGVKEREKDARYTLDFSKPKYLNFFNEDKTNKNGVRKGWVIQVSSPNYQVYSPSHIVSKMAPWTKYQVAVTKYKASEATSSSIYNQNSAHDPVIDFDKFIEDNESIRKEDLVAWVTVGKLHIPCSEDVPNTYTEPNHAKFYIRPFNFFDQDASINSRDAIVINPAEGGQAKVEEFGAQNTGECLPEKAKIKYMSFYK